MTSYSEWLRTLDESALRELVAVRPDAFFPTPPSLGSLATRLSLPGSAAKALRRLTAADFAILERLADAGAEHTAVDVRTECSTDADMGRLRAMTLVYGPDTEARIAPGVLSAIPPGWRVTDTAPVGLEDLLESLPAPQRRVLDTLAHTGGVGTTTMASPDADPHAPIPQLIGKELLLRVDENTVRLPRPVRDVLRGRAPRTIPLTEPTANDPDQDAVDSAATAQGIDAVRHMRQLITELLRSPVALNKDGSVGVRAQAALTKQLGFDPTLMITIGEAAGLVGRGPQTDAGTKAANSDFLAATREGLAWVDATLSDQWAILLAGWMASPWPPHSEGPLLNDDVRDPAIRNARRIIIAHGGDTERILFHNPVEGSSVGDALIRDTLVEGTFLGALASDPETGATVASSPVTSMLRGDDVAATTAPLVPAPVDVLIAQADLTVLAPGPLEPDMASFLEAVAKLESPGLASVWRITQDSLKRAFDFGMTAQQVHEWLETHILGEVPQAISFLVDDTARTHGAIRAGSAVSYIRSDDPALIATAVDKLTARASSGAPQLRTLAPTVAVSSAPLPSVLKALREAGLQPTAEDEHGASLNLMPEPVLVPPNPSRLPQARVPSHEQIATIVGHLTRSDDEDSDTADSDSNEDTLETLRAAARGKRHVTVGYVDKNGQGTTLTVLPLSVGAGQVDALNVATDKVVRIALPRITKAILN